MLANPNTEGEGLLMLAILGLYQKGTSKLNKHLAVTGASASNVSSSKSK